MSHRNETEKCLEGLKVVEEVKSGRVEAEASSVGGDSVLALSPSGSVVPPSLPEDLRGRRYDLRTREERKDPPHLRDYDLQSRKKKKEKAKGPIRKPDDDQSSQGGVSASSEVPQNQPADAVPSVASVGEEPQDAKQELDEADEVLNTMGYNCHLYRWVPKNVEKHWVIKVAPILRAFATADEVSKTVPFISLFSLVHTALRRPSRGCQKNYKKARRLLINRINRIGQPRNQNDAKEAPIRVEEPVIRQVDDPQVADEEEQEQPDAKVDEKEEPRLSKKAIVRMVALTSQGYVKRAVNVVENRDTQPFDHDVSDALQELFPAVKERFEEVEGDFKAAPITVEKDVLYQIIRESCNGAAPGPSGWTPELLLPLVKDKRTGEDLCILFRHIIQKDVSNVVRSLLTASRLIPIPKKNGTIRPIAVPEAFLKIAGKYVLRHLNIEKILPELQVGVGIPGGADIIVHRANRLLRTKKMALSLDITNGFNEVQRAFVLAQLRKTEHTRPLIPLFHLAYGADAKLLYRVDNGTKVILSREGIRQGDPTSSLLFAIALQPALEAAAEELGDGGHALAFVDDTLLIGDPNRLAGALKAFSLKAAEAGLKINQVKSSVLNVSGDVEDALSLAAAVKLGVKTEAEIMGAPVGREEWQKQFVIDYAKERAKGMSLLLDPQVPLQVALSIVLQSRQSTMCYISRMVDPETASDGYEVYDKALREWLLAAIGCRGLPEDRRREAIRQMECPTSVGGLGLLNMKARSTISFLVSVINSFGSDELKNFEPANNTYDSNVARAFEVFQESALLLPELEQNKLKKLPIWNPFNQEGKQDGKQAPLRERQVRRPFKTALRAALYADAKKKVKYDDASPQARRLMTARRMVNASGPSSHCWLYHNGAPVNEHLTNDQMKICLQLLLGAGPEGLCQHCGEGQVDIVTHLSSCEKAKGFRTVRHTELSRTLNQIHRDAGLTTFTELTFVDQKDRNLRLDVVTTDATSRQVALDVMIFSPLAKSYLKMPSPADHHAQKKRRTYDALCEAKSTTFIPFIVTVYGKLMREGHEWLQRIAATWLRQEGDLDRIHTFAEMKRRVYCLFYVRFQRIIANSILRCTNFKRIPPARFVGRE